MAADARAEGVVALKQQRAQVGKRHQQIVEWQLYKHRHSEHAQIVIKVTYYAASEGQFCY